MCMKNYFKIMAMATVAVAAAVFTGCSSDDDLILNYDGNQPQTRAVIEGDDYTITFDDFDTDLMANPTSWGRNYYIDTLTYYHVEFIYDDSGCFESWENIHANPQTGIDEYSFQYGGIALSNWAITYNPSTNPNPHTGSDTLPEGWWYSQYNQMSVYNTECATNADRGGAGAGGSDNFGVVYGYDGYQGWIQEASFDIPKGSTVKSMKICNTAYTYGVIQNGNKWYEDGKLSGTAESLVDSEGYLKLTIKCLNSSGISVKNVEVYLADYRDGKAICPTTWTKIDINAKDVKTVKFSFEGSDTGTYGLNTPAYVAIDDIELTDVQL